MLHLHDTLCSWDAYAQFLEIFNHPFKEVVGGNSGRIAHYAHVSSCSSYSHICPSIVAQKSYIIRRWIGPHHGYIATIKSYLVRKLHVILLLPLSLVLESHPQKRLPHLVNAKHLSINLLAHYMG